MKYSRLFLVLVLTLIAGVFLVAGSLNRQLCCRAASVVDVRVVDDSLQMAVLNVSCSVPISSLLDSLPAFPPDLANSAAINQGTVKPEVLKSEAIKPEAVKPETFKPETFKPLLADTALKAESLVHDASGFFLTFSQETAAALEVKGKALWDYLKDKGPDSQGEDR